MEDLQRGVDYTKKTYIRGRSLYDILKYFDIPNDWIIDKRISCLDTMELFEDNEEITNIDVKWDLELLVNTGSCYGLSVYIFNLIEYIKGK